MKAPCTIPSVCDQYCVSFHISCSQMHVSRRNISNKLSNAPAESLYDTGEPISSLPMNAALGVLTANITWLAYDVFLV